MTGRGGMLAICAALVAPAALAQPALTPAAPADALPQRPGCEAALHLRPGAGAMLELRLEAPCDSGARVVLRHAGLAVTGQVTAGGTLMAALPALADPARVSVLFSGGAQVEAVAEVPDLAAVERFILQWQAPDVMLLHVYEDGADYGAAGHLHTEMAPYLAGKARGVFTRLGDGQAGRAMLAEVYTAPAGAGPALFEIEAPVTAETCGGEVLAETIRLDARGLRRDDLSLAMPDCDAVGETLILLLPEGDEG